jgi:aryl-alcohol dehydrogenase-like predicted oxidoreductase
MKRRSFLKVVGGTTGAYALTARTVLSADTRQDEAVVRVQGMPRRVLGRTGQSVSIVGFPGLALIHQDQEACNRVIRRALDAGINYFDVAPAYGDGDAETKMGVGLQGARDKVFLACKTKARDAKGAREELERSLQRLKTDHLDLYQMHHVVSEDQVQQALGPGGVLETFQKAKAEGKARHFGFSAHTTKAALALLKGFQFDSVMFPINFVEYFTRGFGKDVIDLANQQGTAVVAIKPMCRGAWKPDEQRTRQWWYRPVEDPKEINLALRFTLSLQGVVTGFPPAFLDLLERAVEVGHQYQALSLNEMNALVKLAWDCGSIFKREEEQVAMDLPYPNHPFDPCPMADV